MSRVKGIAALAATATGLVALSPASALGGNITVTTFADDITDNGNCTLREAVQAANTNAERDACPDPGGAGSADTVILGSDTYVIGIAPDGTPDDNLDGDFDLDTSLGAGNLTIQGNGRLVTEIDAEDADRVLHLFGGGSVTIDRVSARNGQRAGSAMADRGAGIFAQSAALTLVSAEVTSNETNAEGGGIAVLFNGSMTWFDSIISGNQSHGSTGGGGIHWQPGTATPTLTLQGTAVTGNEAQTMVAATQMSGGGISSFGKLAVNSGVISGNDALGTAATAGGGVYQNGTSGAATFRSAVIAGNSARTSGAGGTATGGGIYVFNQVAGNAISLDLERSTVSGNFLDNSAGGLQQGGGVYGLNPSRIRVVNSTVSGNMAPDAGGDGGGIHDNGVRLDVHHSTFAENQAADQADAVNLEATQTDTLANSVIAEGADACGGAFFTTVGGNVDAGSSCWLADVTGDVQGEPAQLGPLAQNGGTIVFTHALGLTSPARDRVPFAACLDDIGNPLTEDARGVARPFPVGGACDSGSYELIVCNGAPFTPSGPFTVCPQPPSVVQPPQAKKKKCKKKKKKKSKAGATAAKKRKCKKKRK